MRQIGEKLKVLVEDLGGAAVTLIGWSLGGVITRHPITTIYSKPDGIVNWRASIDICNQQPRNIEVYSSHFGIGANGRVWRLIADTLASRDRLNGR